MKAKNKNTIKIILIIFLSLLLMVVLLYSFQKNQQEYQGKIAKCQYLNQDKYGGFVDPVGLVDCFSIFSIESENVSIDNSNSTIYTVRDNQHNLSVAIIKNLKNYKIADNYLYIYEPVIFPPEKYTRIKYNKDEDWVYPQSYFMNGQVKEINYKSPDEFPNYIQVEILSGEVTLYNTYDQMPEEVKNIFQELENI